MTAARTAHATRFLTPAQAAERIGVTVPVVASYESGGLLTAIRTGGGHRRYDPAGVEAFLAARDEATLAPCGGKAQREDNGDE
jgi:predicted site-specific integrase-resolvase